MTRCYVCNADPQDGCQAIDGEIAECPRPGRNTGGWTIFNSGGAVVREDCTLEEARDCMTPERFERGWNAVYCINVTSQAQLDKLDMEKK
jgi:hypothetical protein